MYKEFTSTINDLTERGLTSEANQLHSLFIKVAALNEAKIKGTLNLTDPARNSAAKEREAASEMLASWLRDKSKSFFTNNELAEYIMESEYENFNSPEALGSALTAEEINILTELIEQKKNQAKAGSDESWGRKERDDQRGGGSTLFSSDEVGSIVQSLIDRSAETVWAGSFFVKLRRSSGNLSDAFITAMIGGNVSFVVSVDSHTLGVKVHSLGELAKMGAQWSAVEQKVVFG